MIESMINRWMDAIKQQLIASYNQRGLRASGNWERELESQVSITESSVSAKMLGSAYTGVMVTGRKPNANQSKEQLRKFVGWAGSTFLAEWVRNKGLKLNPFAVAYKIAREGVNVPNTYNDGKLIEAVLTDERIRQLNRMVGNQLIVDFKSDFVKIFKDGN